MNKGTAGGEWEKDMQRRNISKPKKTNKKTQRFDSAIEKTDVAKRKRRRNQTSVRFEP